MTKLEYWKFILATALSTPRMFLVLFIGHNMSSLSNPAISGKNRALNWVINIVGAIIAFAVGWYIYKHASRRIQRINAGLPPEEGEEGEEELAAQAALQERVDQEDEQQQHNNDMMDPAELTSAKDRHRRQDTEDTVIDMEVINSQQGPVSTRNNHGLGAESAKD